MIPTPYGSVMSTGYQAFAGNQQAQWARESQQRYNYNYYYHQETDASRRVIVSSWRQSCIDRSRQHVGINKIYRNITSSIQEEVIGSACRHVALARTRLARVEWLRRRRAWTGYACVVVREVLAPLLLAVVSSIGKLFCQTCSGSWNLSSEIQNSGSLLETVAMVTLPVVLFSIGVFVEGLVRNQELAAIWSVSLVLSVGLIGLMCWIWRVVGGRKLVKSMIAHPPQENGGFVLFGVILLYFINCMVVGSVILGWFSLLLAMVYTIVLVGKINIAILCWMISL